MWRNRKYSPAKKPTGDGAMPGAQPAESPSLRRFASVVIGGIFALVLIILLGTGNPPLPYRRGQVVESEKEARVSFSVIDEEQTRVEKEAAAAAAPSVYKIDRSAFKRELDSLREALPLMRQAAVYADIDAAKAQSLAVTEELHAALHEAGESWSDDRVQKAVARAFESLIEQGCLSASDVKLEQSRTQSQTVMFETGGKTFRRPLSDLIPESDLATALRATLRGNVQHPPLATALADRFDTPKPFLVYDEEKSAAEKKIAYDNAPPVEIRIDRGDTIVRRDTLLDNLEIRKLQVEQQVYANTIPAKDRLYRLTGLAITVTFLVWLFGAYTSRYQPRVMRKRARMVVLMLLAVASVATTWFLVRWSLAWYIPLSLFAMAVGVAYNALFAIAYALFLAILVGIGSGSNFALSVSLFLGACVGILVMGRVRSRTTPFLAGLAAGGGAFVAAWGTGLLFHGDYTLTLKDSFSGFLSGVASGVMISVLLPFIERGFNVVTELSLLELVDLNKPVLRRLALEAPGTYNHSLFVGNIADAAAEVIGANRLLARAGGYYHDIGKLAKSEYFVENMGTASSRHYDLSPTMSALVIISHVKESVELARQCKLPPPVVSLIREHHGTTLVEYFYREAIEQAGDSRQVNDQSFRYPGPKPHSKEAAIVMLADCVESASRTVTDPTPGKLESLVLDISRGKLTDGQFDESNLTMSELKFIEISLTKSLAGIFHSRIKYPGRDL